MPKMKFLSIAALIALCVGACSGAALAAPPDSWAEITSSFPASMVWDADAAVSVDADNDGATNWDSSFSLRSVEGVTGAAVVVDRWATTKVYVVGTITPTQTYLFDFHISAPPISTVTYALPIGATTVATVSALDCNWILVDGLGALITTDTSANDVSILRFSDTAAGTAGAWAAFQVEECAGRVPMIVQGYGGGIYGPGITVTRNQMAVYMQRAFQLSLSNYTGGFQDVDPGDWADDQIQSCVDAGIVQGYPGTPLPYYVPNGTVDRGQMAVFIARGMAGGEGGVPSGPPTQSFPDVNPGDWNYKHVEYAHANDVVFGYPGGRYENVVPVDRGQMAVFVYRAAVQPTPSNVVLAGPAVTGANVPIMAYDGWTSLAAGVSADPGYAYVGLDAVRASAAGLTVKFELRDAAAPTGAAIAETTVVVGAGAMAGAKAAAAATGIPHMYVSWDIPGGLAADDYILVVSLDGVESLRQPAFTITP